MLVVDDLLVKPFVSLLDILQGVAIQEMYDVDELQDELKENQLLFEIGERDQETYERRREELERQIRIAREVRKQLRGRYEVKR
jgi:hypothetical protein